MGGGGVGWAQLSYTTLSVVYVLSFLLLPSCSRSISSWTNRLVVTSNQRVVGAQRKERRAGLRRKRTRRGRFAELTLEFLARARRGGADRCAVPPVTKNWCVGVSVLVEDHRSNDSNPYSFRGCGLVLHCFLHLTRRRRAPLSFCCCCCCCYYSLFLFDIYIKSKKKFILVTFSSCCWFSSFLLSATLCESPGTPLARGCFSSFALPSFPPRSLALRSAWRPGGSCSSGSGVRTGWRGSCSRRPAAAPA